MRKYFDMSLTKLVPKLVCLGLMLWLCGCNSTSENMEQMAALDKKTYSDWTSAGGNCPVSWRIVYKPDVEFEKVNLGFSMAPKVERVDESVEIKNDSNKKITLVGLLTSNPNENFIDMGQHGAFQLELYPGGTHSYPKPTWKGPVYLKVQDFVLSN